MGYEAAKNSSNCTDSVTKSHTMSRFFVGENSCSVRLLLYNYCEVFCFCSSWKVKNVHLLFTELLRHKPTLHDFGFVVFPPRSPDVWHRDRS